MAPYPYLSPRGLAGLKEYKYKPGNYTILDELHAPLWDATVKCLPTWLAPNLITLTGVVCLLVAYFVTAFYVPDYQDAAPRWVYGLNALAVFLYLHLDCLDGKQARRTGSSSPLGQLFDHGCDALSLSLVMVNLVLCAQPGPGWMFTACIVLGPAIPFILAHWEEYQTGVMLYGSGWWGVTEANYAACLVSVVAFILGPNFWITPIADIIGAFADVSALPGAVVGALAATQPRHVMYVVLLYGTLQTGLPQLYRVLSHGGHGSLPEKERGHKELGRGPALAQLLQITLLFVVWVLLMTEPVQSLWQPRLTTGTFSLVYALQTSRLIVAHMSKEPFAIAVWPVVLMTAQILNARFGWLDLTQMAAAVCALTIVGYLHYVFNVVSQICGALGIQCLRIKPRMA